MSKQLVYEINIDDGNSIKTLNSLEQELKDVNEELKNTAVGSDSFNKLASQSKMLQGEINQLNAQVKGLDFSDKLKGSEAGIKLLTGSTQALVGTLGVLGVESEALGAFEDKAASVIALSNGVKDISSSFNSLSGIIGKLPAPTKAATTANKALNLVLRANPAGLIITAITVLVGLFLVFNKRIREVIATFEPLNKLIEGAVGLFRKLGQALGFVASDAELLAKKQRELAQATADTLSDTLRIQKALGNDTVELERKILNERIKATEEFSAERKKAVVDLQVFEAEQIKKARDDEKKRETEQIARLKEQTQLQKQALEERKRALEAIEKASVITAAEQLAFQLKEVDKEYDELIKAARKYGQSTTQLELARQVKLEQIRKEYNDKITEEEAKRLQVLVDLNADLISLQEKYVTDEEEIIRISQQNRSKDLEESYSQLRNQTIKFYDLEFQAAEGNVEKQAQILAERNERVSIIDQELLNSRAGLSEQFRIENEKRAQEEIDIEREKAQTIQEILFNIDKLTVETIDAQTKLGRDERTRIRLEELEQDRLINLERLKEAGATEEAILQVNKFYSDERVRIKEEAAEAEIQIEKLKNELILDASTALLGSVSGLLKQGSKEYKAFATAEALISTFKAVAKTLSEPTLPFPANVITAATIAAQGIAQVKRIQSTNPGGANSTSIQTPNVGAVNPAAFATIRTPNTGFGEVAGFGQINTGPREPVRAYVISGDVRSGLEADNKIRSRRTIGRE
jgi:hypothetical protein